MDARTYRRTEPATCVLSRPRDKFVLQQKNGSQRSSISTSPSAARSMRSTPLPLKMESTGSVRSVRRCRGELIARTSSFTRGKHVGRGRVSRVQRRHERALRRAPDAIDRDPDVFERAQRAEMCETVSAPAGQDDPDRSTGDVSREPLGVLPAPEPKRMVSHRLGATVSPPSRTLGRFAGCVDENELRGGTASTAPQEASFGRVRRRVPRRRSRDDENFIRPRHAHLRPRRRARVRLQDDEPVIFLLLRHPPREFRPVKFRPQTRDGAVAKLVPRGRFVEPQRRAEHFERASKVPASVATADSSSTRARNQRDGHEIRSRGRTLERGVQLPRHRLEESRRRRRVSRAHQRQRSRRHSGTSSLSRKHIAVDGYRPPASRGASPMVSPRPRSSFGRARYPPSIRPRRDRRPDPAAAAGRVPR